MNIDVISTGTFKLDGGAMFGVVPKKMWSKLIAPDDNNLCTWALRCLLVSIGDRKILIDTGMGDKQDAKFFGHYEPSYTPTLLQSLNNIGLSADDITDVFLTHLHFDHCGGAIMKNNDGSLSTTFKNAIYWSNEKHWQWALQPNDREKASFLKENILPIESSGQLKMIPIQDSFELYENFFIDFMYGHTEAMMLPRLIYNNREIRYCADLLPSYAHIPLPFVMGYDMRPLQTLAEKKIYLQSALASNSILFFEHDSAYEAATLGTSEKGIIINNKGSFQEMLNL